MASYKVPSDARLERTDGVCHYEGHTVDIAKGSAIIVGLMDDIAKALGDLLLGTTPEMPALDDIEDDPTNTTCDFGFLRHKDNEEWARRAAAHLIYTETTDPVASGG